MNIHKCANKLKPNVLHIIFLHEYSQIDIDLLFALFYAYDFVYFMCQ